MDGRGVRSMLADFLFLFGGLVFFVVAALSVIAADYL
ncbi:hypothetical protein QBC99_001135 [Beijerinckia sp. GAS462]|nr:hypothetical protein [Beijerinckia sp. GAS462]